MPHAEFRFPGRRYHATPWGSHVNEGLVEWPPSPWRLCRALIATGFSKLGWVHDGVPEDARSLIACLAETPPTYRLPNAISSHTRHYMPIAGSKTSKVFDTFAHVGDQALGVSWDVELTATQENLLGFLLRHMGYLGRAESWVAAELIAESDLPDHPECGPREDDESARMGWEDVPLLAPIRSEAYAKWRETAVGEALANEGKGLPARKRKQIEAQYPRDLWDCLSQRTSDLQRHGWSQPPGSRFLFYRRPRGSLTASAPRLRRRASKRATVECALLALSSDTSRGEVLPLMSRCLPQAELLHQSLVSLSARVPDAPPLELTGRDHSGQPLTGHRHAFYLPLDLDRDGRLDHVLIHAPMGLGDVSQRAIERLRRTWTKGRSGDLFVSAVGKGSRTEIGSALLGQPGDPGLLDISSAWISHTPFIAPRFIKRRRHTLEDQVRRELEERGFPPPVIVEPQPRDAMLSAGFLDFVRTRRKPTRKPPSTQPWMLKIRFAEPVPGPIAIGYACHYGLGVFRPLAEPLIGE